MENFPCYFIFYQNRQSSHYDKSRLGSTAVALLGGLCIP
jgi:hypothetical protein